MSIGDPSRAPASVTIWETRTDPELAARAARELPPKLLDRLQALPEPARSRRIVQQALRRSVLAGYAGVDPQEIQLTFAPGSAIVSPIDGLAVSASHFEDVTAFAACEGRLALGVDIEPFFEPDWDTALEMVLTESERRELGALPKQLQPARYFEIWTLKESVMKALGVGLGDRDPASIEISTADRDPSLGAIDGSAPADPWRLWSGSVSDHIISLAVRGAPRLDVSILRWPG